MSGADITFTQVFVLRFLCGFVLSRPYKNLNSVSINHILEDELTEGTS